MRRKRGNSNIKILQSQIQNLALSNAEEDLSEAKEETKRGETAMRGSGAMVPIVDKIKKKGIPKDALINTKRLLTM